MVVLIVMGVCGCGKTTIGRALSTKIGCDFADADDWHPETNIKKMTEGIPLTDQVWEVLLFMWLTSFVQDRLPWLQSLNQLLQGWEGFANECEGGPGLEGKEVRSEDNGRSKVKGVLACSALKREYRKILTSPRQGSKVNCIFVVLNGSETVIRKRMSGRDHFMPPGLLQSQFEALELPTPEEGNRLIRVDDISLPVKDMVENILSELSCMTQLDHE